MAAGGGGAAGDRIHRHEIAGDGTSVMDIEELLELNKECRRDGMNPLIDLDEMGRLNERYSFSILDVPKIESLNFHPCVGSLDKLRRAEVKILEMKARNENIFKCLNFSDEMWNNVLITGGSVIELLKYFDPDYNPRYQYAFPQIFTSGNNKIDIDLFLYGLTAEESTVKVQQILNRFVEVFYQNIEIRYFNNLRFIYTKNLITVLFDRLKVEIILRLNPTKESILYGFDLGSAQVGFDGFKLYFTPLSYFAYMTGYNILDPNQRSPTYEYRLSKHIKKGFGVIMPYLKPDAFNEFKESDIILDREVDYNKLVLPNCVLYKTKYYDSIISKKGSFVLIRDDVEREEDQQIDYLYLISKKDEIDDDSLGDYENSKVVNEKYFLTKMMIEKLFMESPEYYLVETGRYYHSVYTDINCFLRKVRRMSSGKINLDFIMKSLKYFPDFPLDIRSEESIEEFSSLVHDRISTNLFRYVKNYGQINEIPIHWTPPPEGSHVNISWNPLPMSFEEYYGEMFSEN